MNCRSCGESLFEGAVDAQPAAGAEIAVDPRAGATKVELGDEVHIDADGCTFKKIFCASCKERSVPCGRLVLATPDAKAALRDKCVFDRARVSLGAAARARRPRQDGHSKRIENLHKDYQILLSLAKETVQHLERIETILQRIFQMIKLVLQQWKKGPKARHPFRSSSASDL